VHTSLEHARNELVANGFSKVSGILDPNGEWWWPPGKWVHLFLQHCKQHPNCCDNEQLQHIP
jgi:hypothetical protein